MQYSKLVLKHFTNPKNQGRLKNPDGVGMVGNPACGDIMTVYIKVKRSRNKDVISDIKFETLGCAAAIATSSMVTQLAKGKILNDAFKITRGDIALRRAIEDYISKSGKQTEKKNLPPRKLRRTRRKK